MDPRDSSAAWQIAELRAPHFTATLHKRVLFDVVELRCKTAFEPVGNCGGLMDIAVESLAGGSLVLLWADRADLCYYQLTASLCPAYGPVRGKATGSSVCFSDVKELLLWQGDAQGNGKTAGHFHPCFWLHDSVYCQSPCGQRSCNKDCNSSRRLSAVPLLDRNRF